VSENKDETNKARASRPNSAAFKEFLSTGWAEPDDVATTLIAAAPYAASRRDRLSAQFPGRRIVVPAGGEFLSCSSPFPSSLSPSSGCRSLRLWEDGRAAMATPCVQAC